MKYFFQSTFILDAIGCLSTQQYTDVYSIALVSYAYSLLGMDSFLAQIAMEKLQQFKRVQGYHSTSENKHGSPLIITPTLRSVMLFKFPIEFG